ncbi:astacin-like metalloendopeptidase [Hyperolius riggenbachi]|uniref:astacin-like metalloendopeptidase n=1 Tax=Hyperolius riggenbachi TaxID=752182 RepID=UPI0035A31AA2
MGSAEEEKCEDVFSHILRINKESTLKLFQGDIVENSAYSVTPCTNCLWPKLEDGRVRIPYTLSSDYSNDEKYLITEAFETFNTLTCIQFVKRSTEVDYLNIQSQSGCWSSVGKIGGAQYISLMKGGCMVKGVVQHEIQHSLGFYHEQSRSDRDQHVDVMWQYIGEENWHEFEMVENNNMELPYDHSSVMHYGRFAYSNTSGKPSLSPKPDQSVEIGQRYGLSSLDIYKIKKLYDCSECSYLLTGTGGSLDFGAAASIYSDATTCVWLVRVNRNKAYLQFDGFDALSSGSCESNFITIYDGSSRNAPILVDRVCPGWELPLLVASGSTMLVEFSRDNTISSIDFKASYGLVDCGGTFTQDNGTVTSPGFPNLYPNLADCITTIWAPPGYQIALIFTAFDVEYSVYCDYDYLLIHDGGQLDSPILGQFCSNDPIPPVTSSGNVLLLQFISDHWLNTAGYSADYHFVRSS